MSIEWSEGVKKVEGLPCCLHGTLTPLHVQKWDDMIFPGCQFKYIDFFKFYSFYDVAQRHI